MTTKNDENLICPDDGVCLAALEEKRPGSVADALDSTDLAQIDTMISELNRVKRLARDAQVARLLEV